MVLILFPSLSYYSTSCIHSNGGITPFSANNIPTVYPFLFVYNGSCLHSSCGICPFYASIIAGELSSLSNIDGYYHSSGTSIFF